MAQVYRGGRIYPTGAPNRLTPYEVRNRRFEPRRRGVDPDQVHEFQIQVADELADLRHALDLLAVENDRLKRALRDWQTMHNGRCNLPRPAPGNAGHW